jgi:uncharacterized membrane protein
MTGTSYDWLGFVGRLHPLLVHLPIGFIVFLAIIEVAAFWAPFKEAMTARRLLLLMSVVSVLVSAGCGWILSWSGGYGEKALVWHKWLGTGLVPTVILLQVLLRRRAMLAYRICLGFTMILLVFAGDYGNTLVRGEGYLFHKSRMSATGNKVGFPAKDPAQTISEKTAFTSLVQPIFNKYCIRCHGEEKSKAKLRLDAAEYLFKGGKSGLVVHPGSVAQSLLIKRMRLPLDDDDHMPPEGKKQPTAREMALLEWWVNVGAPADKTVNELKMPDLK